MTCIEGAQTTGDATPNGYLAWNDALAARVFRPEMAGREVFLFVNEDLITEIGGPGCLSEFVAHVEVGPAWVSPGRGLCQKALQAMEGWRQRNLEYPPYIAYLGLFVLAVGVQGDFAAHAYYPRLRTLLGWTDVSAGAPPSFDQMLSLWDDLEVWSNQDMEGSLGVFSIRIAGAWIHVGLPKAQAILTERERHALPKIFSAAGLDPMAPPSDPELIRKVSRHGAHVLRRQTIELLGNRNSEPELLAVALDVIRSELELWDGLSEPDESQSAFTVANARICLRTDETAGAAIATLRVASKAEFPNNGLLLESAGGQQRYTCIEDLPGWTSPLIEDPGGRSVDASVFNWSRAHVLVDHLAGWQVRIPASRIRIFVPGVEFGLAGWVEIQRLPRGRPFMLAVSEQIVISIEEWAASDEVNLRRRQITEGIPRGWVLFESVEGAIGDSRIRDSIPELTLPSAIRILLRGGIRSGEGNSFFGFSPPLVVIEGGSGGEQVFCNDIHLRSIGDTPTFRLPNNLPVGVRTNIEVRSNGETLKRQSLFISEPADWIVEEPLRTADRFGKVHQEVDTLGGSASGAVCWDMADCSFNAKPALPAEGHRAFLIGRCIGEISTWPSQCFPTTWDPVWIVEMNRRGKAQYVAVDLECAGPDITRKGTEDAQLLWKQVLWNWRERIERPRHPILSALWISYTEVARNV